MSQCTLTIDYSACIGCGACAEIHPGLFEMRDGKAWLKAHGELTPAECENISRVCPVNAILAGA